MLSIRSSINAVLNCFKTFVEHFTDFVIHFH